MISESAEQTLAIGRELGAKLAPGTLLSFHGDLGAGKTTMIRGIVEGATGHSDEPVSSPTYTLLNIYADQIAHFDLYRLTSEEEFYAMGFDEQLESGLICCIEWAERVPSLADQAIKVSVEHISEEQRRITIEGGP